MNRHQRRKRSLLRLAEKLRTLEARRVQEVDRQRKEKVRDNLSNPRRGERSPRGMGNLSIYDGAATPVGFSKPLTWTRGACK